MHPCGKWNGIWLCKGKTIGPIRKFRKIVVRTLLFLLVFCVVGTVILSLPAVQTRLAKMAMDRINSDFGTDIRI